MDESKEPRTKLLRVLTETGTSPKYDHVSLLITSRDEKDIRDAIVATQAMRKSQLMDLDVQSELAAVKPYTELSMENNWVMEAIRIYVKKQVGAGELFQSWTPGFRAEVEELLSRGARGMFRWVACQIDILKRLYMDKAQVREVLADLPETHFETYEKVLLKIPPQNRGFARTALALICSPPSRIPSAEVLVQASLHNVLRGEVHRYGIENLRRILGCLIKVTDMKRKPATLYKRHDEESVSKRVDVAHYTVKEYLFASSTAKGRAKEFALSSGLIRKLEMQVVFNSLQQFEVNRRKGIPTRFEEYCLSTGDRALRDKRTFIVKEESVWKALIPCLGPGSMHLTDLRNAGQRAAFPRWAILGDFEEYEETEPDHRKLVEPETRILVSLVLLRWPELAQKFLNDEQLFKDLSVNKKRAVWTDKFTLKGNSRPETLLRLCVARKRVGFLEMFIKAGATFHKEPDIIFTALEDPYTVGKEENPYSPHKEENREERDDDGTVTGKLLKLLLEQGADPNPPGYRFTPLQDVVHHLEEGWVQSLLCEGRDANVTGDPNGDLPYGNNELWHRQHPLKICRTIRPAWQGGEGVEDETHASQVHVSHRARCKLLTSSDRLETTPVPEGEPFFALSG
ncbi:Uu.00g001660.m01.CDS01 [Anthostomella pinea]|uniref:Uu.00g001660.m01.CDS01 n=1 Tax=Anthostomella pinea TaxID=933095 RepID=A0AAI8VK19_9PEZI|nr:Uu.00g001660.m01.CDS01 [Anthostomella pinea]